MKTSSSIVTFLVFAMLTAQCNSSTLTHLEKVSQIAFISTRDGNAEIYTINIDGTGLKRLTNSPLGDSNPLWSPDGSKLAFIYGRPQNGNVFIMNADGTHQRQITSNASAFYLLSFMDEKRLLFASRDWEKYSWENNSYHLAIAYTNRPYFVLADKPFGSMSPDESKIAYQEKIDVVRSDISILDITTSEINRVTNNGLEERLLTSYSPVWSPSGSKLAFITSSPSEMQDYSAKIYLVNADGTGLQLLTDEADKFHPVQWSPNGRKIAFQFQYNIYTINIDGTNRTQITSSGDNSSPMWSPDGLKIVFTSHRNGNWDIFVVDSDGSHLVQLTYDEKDDYNTAWRP